MRILIFSDTYLNTKFNVRKYRLLKKIIQQHDTIIINGDFWDGNQVNFEDFVKSKWKTLFPYLKSKHTVYIYGDHDKQELSDDNTSLFSNLQTKRYRFVIGSRRVIVEHGDRIVPGLETFLRKHGLKAYEKYFKLLDKFYRLNFGIITRITTKLVFKLFSQENKLMKMYAQNQLKENELLICGHTHYPEIDLSRKFANCGFINGGYVHYIEIEDDAIKLVESNYL